VRRGHESEPRQRRTTARREHRQSAFAAEHQFQLRAACWGYLDGLAEGRQSELLMKAHKLTLVYEMILTEEEEQLLNQLKTAGERGRAASALDCSPAGLARLLRAGYVISRSSNGRDVMLYRITDAGKQELMNVASLCHDAVD
jgi:hypothetical protein